MCEFMWNPLATIFLKGSHDNKEINCLCSRVFIQNKDIKFPNDTRADQCDLSEEEKRFEIDDKANNCSSSSLDERYYYTDDIDDKQNLLQNVQSSDSGADLSECTNNLSKDLNSKWQKYWAQNGEKLIWQSWIEKYSDYINPDYLVFNQTDSGSEIKSKIESKDTFSKFNFDEKELNNFNKNFKKTDQEIKNRELRRELSDTDDPLNQDVSEGWNPLSPVSVDCETEIERLLSPRCGSHASGSVRTVDSMTNVTRMTVSSVDFNKSSESLSSVSSVETSLSSSTSEDFDGENQNQWNQLWRQHYEAEYLVQYNKYIKINRNQLEKSFLKNITYENLKRKTKERKSLSLEVDVISNLITNMSTNCNDSEESMDISKKVDDEEENEMLALGLPTSFGNNKCFKKCKSGLTRQSQSLNDEKTCSNFLSNRNRVNATFKLLGIEFNEGTDEKMTGRVNYKMKGIRFQNNNLKFGHHTKKPRHSYFDDYGNLLSQSESSDAEDSDELPIDDLSYQESLEKDFCTLNTKLVKSISEDKDIEEDCFTFPKVKRKKRRKKINYPLEIRDNPKLKKFWHRRYSLFSKFDEGIKLDEESWYSVTPELVAKNTAERCKCDVIIDAFCGAGGNTIQFAQTCKKVIAIDIDSKKIEMARHNSEVYGVSDKIEFIVGDYVSLSSKLKADVVFLSPPWGGPTYLSKPLYELEQMLQPIPFSQLMNVSKAITNNIALFLPKNTNTYDIIRQAGEGGSVEIEQNFINKNLIAITAYYNDLIKKTSE